MAFNYANEEGIAALLSEVRKYVPFYANCSTAASTAAKEINDLTGFSLRTGATIRVKFANSNTAQNPTLNINDTGAKSIYKYGSSSAGITAGSSWESGAVVTLTYDGTAWIMNDWIDAEFSDMTGATAENPGTAGLVPAPAIGDQNKVLTGNGGWGLPGVVTINGRSPNPATGDIVVIEGGGSSSYGSYRLDATIAPSDWVTSNGVYTVTITNQYITANMDGTETWLDDETVVLGETSFVSGDGNLVITTSVKPTATWYLHIMLAVNGADILADVSTIRANVSEIETKLGSPSSASSVTGADAFSKIDAVNSKLGTVPSGETIEGQITSINSDITTINSALRPSNASWNNNVNANDYKTTGQYMFGSGCTNVPTSWGILTVTANRADTIMQEYEARNQKYVRECRGTDWSDWNELALKSDINTLNSKIGNVQRGQVTGITLAQGQTEVTVNLPEAYSSGNAYVAVANLCFYGGAATFSAVLIRQQYTSSFVCRISSSNAGEVPNVALNWITMSV